MFRKVLREPLLHFAVVGSLLFFFLSLSDPVKKQQIIISKAKIEQLSAQFSKTRQRPPTAAELKALIDNQLREELAFRQGSQMGLVENDVIIKRRVQQKIEFMLNDSIATLEPGKEQLQAYLNAHPESYSLAPVYSFKQIYINPDKHADGAAFIAELRAQGLDEIYRDSGDRLMLDSEYADASTAEIARLFGRKFVVGLETLNLQQWSEPVKSGYGLHLIYIEKKLDRRLASLDEVEDQVKRDYQFEAQKKALDNFYQELLNKYEVIIEQEWEVQ